MKALLCIGAAVPAGICASKASNGTGFGLLGRCQSLSFPRSTGPFIRAALCGCSRDTPAPVSEDPDNRQDGEERDVPIVEPTRSWMMSWEMLLDHIFRPPPGEDELLVQLMEPISKLLQNLKQNSKIGHAEYEVLLDLIQVYFNLKDYEKAKAIQDRIRDCKMHSEKDSRPYLLEAIVNLTLAMEKLRQGDEESKKLIESAEKSWRDYEKLKEEGFGLLEPTGPPED